MLDRRRRKLIAPGLQLRLILHFLAAASVAVLVEAILLNHLVNSLAHELPHDESILLTEWPRIFRLQLLVAFGLLVPSITLIGIQASFRIAGPLRRFQDYLERLAAGEDPGPCRVRKNDELQELCELLDRATAPLRAEGQHTQAHSAPGAKRSRAA